MFNTISNQASKLINLTRRNKQLSKTKLITITSGKGGVGKSTFTGNIAYLLSSRGFKVAVIDADIGLANMQVLFDIKPKFTLFDYIEGKITIEEALLQTSYKNLFLVAGKSGYQYANHSNSFVFARIVEDVINLNEFDIVLIDTGAGLNEYVKEFLAISNNILAITTTDPSALTDLYALMKMLSKDKEELMLCFNHTRNHQIGDTISNSLINLAKKNRLNDNFMVKYIGNVSTSANISTTGRLRKLFSHEFKNDDSTRQLQAIIDTLLKNIK
ncbi:AAA family ATPase [Malaciobacter mytili]|uniref:ATP-binding protein n=1 Tax=Malaciobacter mytili LMG 24559 TaxID=1032238 RepID=A0AAX2AGY4_9BACT|nr:AAA family ATPase [Malaciobacter mytili]AXH15753.1 polar flagellar biogenesis regulatory protein FlhG [Malaciobacter mytili LMG 24559]RXI41163.1 ATP-binding protein [Malaciobacter mytili]RXK15424.1 ATP-binding protein [Malaciobacter mytili LMG 24559]